jgi:23S rRNA pseudouridine1911/1915/1917 synthase
MTMHPVPAPPLLPPAPQVEPTLLAQSDEWLVVNKPPGWLSVPGRPPTSPAPSQASKASGPPTRPRPLAEAPLPSNPQRPVILQWAQAQLPSSEDRLYPVHRLDFETSGVLLFARTPEAHRKACQAFQSRKTQKTYLLLAHGPLPALPLLKLQSPIEGAPSTTQLEILQAFDPSPRHQPLPPTANHSTFLARATPLTGRRHQIRIHLARLGTPLLGDGTYGGLREAPGGAASILFSRVALHAFRLRLPSGEVFEAPLPADFETWLSQLQPQASSPMRYLLNSREAL